MRVVDGVARDVQPACLSACGDQLLAFGIRASPGFPAAQLRDMAGLGLGIAQAGFAFIIVAQRQQRRGVAGRRLAGPGNCAAAP